MSSWHFDLGSGTSWGSLWASQRWQSSSSAITQRLSRRAIRGRSEEANSASRCGARWRGSKDAIQVYDQVHVVLRRIEVDLLAGAQTHSHRICHDVPWHPVQVRGHWWNDVGGIHREIAGTTQHGRQRDIERKRRCSYWKKAGEIHGVRLSWIDGAANILQRGASEVRGIA